MSDYEGYDAYNEFDGYSEYNNYNDYKDYYEKKGDYGYYYEKEKYNKGYYEGNKDYLSKKYKRDNYQKEEKLFKESYSDKSEKDEEFSNYDKNSSEDSQDSYEFNCQTGDIGEKIVYDDLKNNKKSEKITWTNKKGESFEPFDFKIKKGKKTIYIDAKSTIYEKGDDPLPIITENEQNFINNLKPNEKYYIARVFNARGKNPKIKYYDAQTMKKVKKSKILK